MSSIFATTVWPVSNPYRTVRSACGALVSLYASTERLIEKFLLSGELVRVWYGPYSHVAENSQL